MVTILTATEKNGKVPKMAKTFTKIYNNVIKRDYDKAYRYASMDIECKCLGDISTLLMALEDHKHSVIIRGKLIDGIDESDVLRRKDAYDGEKAYFAENPDGLKWACMDFDKIPTPEGLITAEQRLEYLVSLLPECFHDVSYHYQWSSSAGLGGWDTLSCHLWYWFSQPHKDSELCGWALGQDVDDATHRTVQPIYTAAPVFVGVDDPMSGVRSGLVVKATHEVDMPVWVPPPVTQGTYSGGLTSSQKFEAALAAIGPRYHMPIQRAIACYVGIHGTDTDVAALKDRMRDAIWSAPMGVNGKNVYLDDRYLDQSIQGAMRKYGNHTPNKSKMALNDVKRLAKALRRFSK